MFIGLEVAVHVAKFVRGILALYTALFAARFCKWVRPERPFQGRIVGDDDTQGFALGW